MWSHFGHIGYQNDIIVLTFAQLFCKFEYKYGGSLMFKKWLFRLIYLILLIFTNLHPQSVNIPSDKDHIFQDNQSFLNSDFPTEIQTPQKILKLYNRDSCATVEINQNWHFGNTEWVNRWRKINTYDNDNHIEMLKNNWTGNYWAKAAKENFIYDGNNNLIERTKQEWTSYKKLESKLSNMFHFSVFNRCLVT